MKRERRHKQQEIINAENGKTTYHSHPSNVCGVAKASVCGRLKADFLLPPFETDESKPQYIIQTLG